MTPGVATTRSLAGTWGFRLDPERRGGRGTLVRRRPAGFRIALPGSTDDAGYGRENDAREVTYLTRTHVFEGQAWYQKEIEIPPQWAGKSVLLFLERCLWETELWVDEERVGYRDSLLTPAGLRPHPLGEPRCPPPDPAGGQHAARHAETVPQPRLHRAYPDGVERRDRQDRAVMPGPDTPCRRPGISERGGAQHPHRLEGRQRRGRDRRGDPELQRPAEGHRPTQPPVSARQSFAAGGIDQPAVVTELALGSDALLWDEFSPNLYQLEVTLRVPHRSPRATGARSPSGCGRWGRGARSSCSTAASCSCAAPTTAATRR